MLRRTLPLTILIIHGLRALVIAQDQASTRQDHWTLPESRLGTRTAPILLLTRPEVQADLKLDATQIAGAQATINDLTRRAMTLRGKTGTGVISERRAIDEAQSRWLGQNLSGNQLERLTQLDIQWEGASAIITRPTVGESIQLNPGQRQNLVQLVAEHNARRAKGMASPSDRALLASKMEVLLSDTQRELWGRILGSPCNFSAPTAVASPRDLRDRDDAIRRAGHDQPTP